MPIVEFTHGSVDTTGQGSMDIFVSYRRDRAVKEQAIHEAIADPKSGLKEPGGVLEFINSSRIGAKRWVKRRVDTPAGSYIKFTIRQVKPSGVFRSSILNFMIAPRESAPLMEIAIKPPFVAGKNNLSRIYITGRYDILTSADVVKRGLHINAQGADDTETFDFEGLQEIMDFTVLEKALKPKAEVKIIKTGSGKAVARIRKTRRVKGF